MLELPELYKLVQYQRQMILNQTIRELNYGLDIHEERSARGQKIIDIRRHGNGILYLFSRDFLLVNPDKKPKFIITEIGEAIEQGYYFSLLTDQRCVSFYGTRASFCYGLGDQVALPHVGVDPLSKQFNLRSFQQWTHGYEESVSSLLKDQTKIAGIGQRCSRLILKAAKIPYQRAVNSLSHSQIESLFWSIKQVLRDEIVRSVGEGEIVTSSTDDEYYEMMAP